MAIGVHLAGDNTNNTLNGGADDDVLAGLDGSDTLNGLAGDDVLDGGALSDIMAGGTGDDLYYVDHHGDVTLESADEGWDIVRASVSHQLQDNVEQLVLVGAAATGYGNDLDNVILGRAAGNDHLAGYAGNDRLQGRGGDDILWGGDGDDTLDGGSGQDSMSGGAGNDTYLVDDALDDVFEMADEGTDTVRSTATTYTISEFVERLVLVRGDIDGTGNGGANDIIGSSGDNELYGAGGDDALQGRGGDDSLFGGDGNDRLDGGTGINTLEGGTGDDTYFVANGVTDTVVELADGGYDTVRVSAGSYTLPDHVEALVLLGTARNGTGNALDNVITGSGGDDNLYGRAGNDRILGGDGWDQIEGGDGNDTLFGGAGDDFLIGGDGIDRMLGGDGGDSFIFSNETSIGDTFDGGAGVDTLAVGENGETNTVFDLTTGNFRSIDVLAVNGTGNTVIIGPGFASQADADDNGSPGQLEVWLSPTSDNTSIDASGVGLGQGQISLVVFGAGGSVDFIGSANNDRVELGDGNDIAGGGGGDDELAGFEGDDTLLGGAGDDILDGGEGDDILWGGAGNDTFYFYPDETGHDTIQDFAAGDLIDVSDLLGIDDLADFQSVVVAGADTVITIDDDTTITLVGYASLSNADFLFA